MNGYCYSSDGVNPTFATNKGEESDDDGSGNMFLVDATNQPEERDVANCLESRQRGTTRNFKQVGNLVCVKIK